MVKLRLLDLNIIRNYENHAIAMSQSGYIDRLFAKSNMKSARSASTPFEIGTKFKLAIVGMSNYIKNSLVLSII